MIIFDLGGVLLQEAESNIAYMLPQHVDVGRIDGKPPRFFLRMFEFANLICKRDIKREWLLGRISNHEIIEKITQCVEQTEYDSFFKSQQERNLIKHGTAFLIDPEQSIELTTLITEGFEFVQTCKRSGMRIVFLSNWEPESFVLLRKKFPELFDVCDEQDIIIPAKIGHIKPDRAAFDYIVHKSGYVPQDIFFVEDNVGFVVVAQEYGITAVHHTDWKQTELELVQKGFKTALEKASKRCGD
jgi:FMN phosphatase YigB (HAD superfamily)